MRALSRFGPPLALMAAIFFLSAQPDLSSGLGVWDTILRKLAHMAEYGLLWWLWYRALGLRSAAAAVAITLAYAGSDEYHQTFVEGRHGSPVDVLIDAVGVAVAFLLTRGLRGSGQVRRRVRSGARRGA
jgi:VanZ family protein